MIKEEYSLSLDQQQQFFGEELTDISPKYIQTTYGKVFSITAGTPGQPLILIVHGSGPTNSSDQYNYLLQEYLVRVSYMEKFYIVAIDCPGYGKSIGSKEAIKTFPLQLFQELLEGLGYKKYFAMFGHSQGGSAIFNAVYEKSDICDFLVMDRPVCGNIQRFEKFQLPTLLVYDIEDDGHPIWQGKQLYKQLAKSELYTYRDSKDPYWVPDNIWNLMLQFFSKNSLNKSLKASFQRVNRPTSSRFSCKQDSRKTSRHNIMQKVKFLQRQKTVKKSISPRKTQSLDVKQAISHQKKLLEENLIIKNRLQMVEEEKEELLSVASHSLSEESAKQVEQIKKELKEKEKELLQKELLKQQSQQGGKKHRISEQIIIQGVKPQDALSIPKPNAALRVNPEEKQCKDKDGEANCAICYDTHYRPLETNCGHVFCSQCILQSLLVDQRCPLCRAKVTKKTQLKGRQEKIIQMMNKKDAEKREKAYLRLKVMLDSIVYIEIGNKSVEMTQKKSAFSKTKTRYNWEVYAKEKPNFKFEEVTFNINMGNEQAKPVRVKNAPFSFENKGTFSFSCEITIKPKSKEYSALTSIYRINVEPGVHSKKIAFKKKVFM